jgi:hypothetical protein
MEVETCCELFVQPESKVHLHIQKLPNMEFDCSILSTGLSDKLLSGQGPTSTRIHGQKTRNTQNVVLNYLQIVTLGRFCNPY